MREHLQSLNPQRMTSGRLLMRTLKTVTIAAALFALPVYLLALGPFQKPKEIDAIEEIVPEEDTTKPDTPADDKPADPDTEKKEGEDGWNDSEKQKVEEEPLDKKPGTETATTETDKPKDPGTPSDLFEDKVTLDDINFDYEKRKDILADIDSWYWRGGMNVNFFSLGPDIERAFGQIEGVFGGESLPLQFASKTTTLQMQADQAVARAPTNFIPTGNIGFGFVLDKGVLELDIGFAGLVPLNTANYNTPMTITEVAPAGGCASGGDPLANCPLRRLGFVDEVSGQGDYTLNFIINERVWVLTPSVYYDHYLKDYKFGRLSVGGSFGLVIFSTIQQVEFSAVKNNVNDTLGKRVIEGAADSIAINDWGPIMRLYLGITRKVGAYVTDIRFGINYGFVNLRRDVDGNGTAVLGNSLVASFPISAVGIANQETNRFELLGAFVQVGVRF